MYEPSFGALQALAPSVRAAGFAPSVATAGCDYQPAVRAGTVAGLGKAYRFSSGVDATGCPNSRSKTITWRDNSRSVSTSSASSSPAWHEAGRLVNYAI